MLDRHGHNNRLIQCNTDNGINIQANKNRDCLIINKKWDTWPATIIKNKKRKRRDKLEE